MSQGQAQELLPVREVIEPGAYDNADVGGIVIVEVIRDGPNGPRVIERRVGHNLIVNQGKKRTPRMTVDLITKQWRFFRLGKNSAAAGSADTNVKTAFATATIRTSDSRSLLAGTRTLQVIVSYQSGGGSLSLSNIKEVVLLDQKTTPGGSCFMRAVITAVNKTTADKLKIDYRWRIT